MGGKETRFGIAASALFATVTTDASCRAVNSTHDSYTPIGGLVPMFNIQTDEVIFGGTGSGLYGMLLYAIMGVFIAGLTVGQTPEYIGKKIQQKEVKMALFAILFEQCRDGTPELRLSSGGRVHTRDGLGSAHAGQSRRSPRAPHPHADMCLACGALTGAATVVSD